MLSGTYYSQNYVSIIRPTLMAAESHYVQTLLMRNKLRSLPLRCDFTLSSPPPLAATKHYRKLTESYSINAISLSVQIQEFSST